VAVLVAQRPGRDALAQPSPEAAAEVAPAPAPPRGSVTFARQSRELAVALAVRPGRPLRLVATIIGSSGHGVDGLDVQLVANSAKQRASASARNCGHGCYEAPLRLLRPIFFGVGIAGAGRLRSVGFPVAGPWPPKPGTAFLRRATRIFRGLRSAVYAESLASGLGNAIETTWRLASPDRIEYTIRGGAAGIVIGTTRWDRSAPGDQWRRSGTTALEQPFPPWGTRATEVRVLRRTDSRVTLSWLDPTVPAWYTGTFDPRTALPRELHMTAAAHFMQQRFVAYNSAIKIEPPT
jgi:hypothetical protein